MDQGLSYVEGNYKVKLKDKAFYLEVGEYNLITSALTNLLEQASSRRGTRQVKQRLETKKTAQRILNHLAIISKNYGLGARSDEDVSVVVARFSQKMLKLMREVVQERLASVLLSRDDIFQELANTDASGKTTELFTRLSQLGKLTSVLRRFNTKLKDHSK